MKNKIFILLDRSGSMSSMWEEAIGGINSYVKNIKMNADITVAAFDTLSYEIVRNTTVDDWTNIKYNEIEPRAGTPLLDATARIMHNMVDSKASRAILVVVTDGDENSSQKYNKNDIKKLTSQITNDLDYELVFLGANFDKVGDVAVNNYGWNLNNPVMASRVIPTSARGFGTAMNATATATTGYFNTGKAEAFYSDSDKVNAKQ